MHFSEGINFVVDAMACRRINKELKDWTNDNGIFAAPKEDDIFHWEGIIVGPKNSLYEHGLYHFTVTLPPDYPFKPPKVRIVTPVWHMNICSGGCHICTMDEINDRCWSPRFKLRDVLCTIRNTFLEPFPSDRTFYTNLQCLYRHKRDKYGKLIRNHVIQKAVPATYGDVHGFSQELIHEVSGVPSLHYQCKKQIRFAIKLQNPWDITEDIESLPLPYRMKEFLK